ncbi:MAG: molybdate ABC transporter substrate-binding protein [Planctomycetota bacterium]|nr:molybdate ABC transporter substrate-binding protein [Planctomycetota bacterium]
MRSSTLIATLVLLATLVLGVMVMRHSSAPPSSPREATHLSPATQPGTQPAAAPSTQPAARVASLRLACAAGVSQAVTQIAHDYEAETGIRIDTQFGGSGNLLSGLRVSGEGDLFLAADQSYIDAARKDGLVREAIPLAQQIPVIAVAKGNPKKIHTLADLARADLRIAIANPDAASIGKVTQRLLDANNARESIETAARDHGVFKPTVNEIANDVKLGSVDAGIVWDSIPRMKEYGQSIDAVAVDGAEKFSAPLIIGVLKTAKNPTAALHFARYLSARDKGLPVLERMGFRVVAGDLWAERPRLLVFAGAVNRRGMQETLSAFEAREGCEITTVYNGCGILNGQIKLGERPDLYQTCDISFMKEVDDNFDQAHITSRTDIVLLVGKGNPKSIKTLAGMAGEGLRVGLCNEKQSTLGTLTANLLRKMEIYDGVWKNVVVTTPTADMLVAQLRTGSLDAAVVYKANTVGQAENLDVLPIADELAEAKQSVAVGKNSDHKQLADRLSQALRSVESRDRYQAAGFQWIDSESK